MRAIAVLLEKKKKRIQVLKGTGCKRKGGKKERPRKESRGKRNICFFL
ncbi:hypothetical protein C5S39_06355 [Candidatus Methanophagaceae archaeon]|jgi:hypothetical protein|nr:hypothetical protein C5S39_06355 [Methanophagales archaeon]